MEGSDNKRKIRGIGIVVLLVVINSAVLFYFVSVMKNQFLDVYSDALSESKNEYYNKYADEIGRTIESEIDSIFRELAIMGNIVQNYIDHSDEFFNVTVAMKSNSYFEDKMIYSGKWYQNTSDEPATVHVQRYLLDENNEIKKHVQEQIDDTLLMDLLIPSFIDYGIEKLLVYFQGGVEASFARIAPWVDLGNLMDDVYPAYTDEPTWETFNPGLVGQWEEMMKSNPEYGKDNRFLMKASPPVQDGVTGQLVITFGYPIWNGERTEFRGTVGYDVPIDRMLELVENVQIAESGFAFLSQSNGNLFAVNEDGAEILGFGSVEEHTDVTGEGIGFNRLNRMLSESAYEAIQNIELPTTSEVIQKDIFIENAEYTLVLKQLKPFMTWYPETSFEDENWILGFVVPKQESYYSYSDVETNIRNYSYLIVGVQSLLIIIILAGAFIVLRKKVN